MKKPTFHVVYLALIAALLFWNFKLKTQNADMTRTLALTEGVLRLDNEVLIHTGVYLYEQIDKLNLIYRSPSNDSFMTNLNMFDLQVDSIERSLQKLQDDFLLKNGGIEAVKKNIFNKYVFGDSLVLTIKKSLKSLEKHIESNVDPKEKDRFNQRLFAKKLLNDSLFWSNFNNSSSLSVWNTLYILRNTINIDRIMFYNYQSTRNTFCGYINEYRVNFFPKKAAIIEGETFQADLALTNTFRDYDKNIEFKVNGQPLNHVNGLAQYTITPKNIGYETFKVEVTKTSPLTGEKQTFWDDFGYRVLPKCSVNCQ